MMQRQRILWMTVSSSLTPTVAGYDRPTSTRVVSHGPTHGSATGALQPLDRGSGTVCQPDNDIGEFLRQLKSFLPCDALRCTVFGIVILSVCLSVCLSVRPSVTLVDCPHGSTYDHDFFTIW